MAAITDSDYRHLLNLCRALRLAQKGNLASGIKPDLETAKRLEAAIDLIIAERDGGKLHLAAAATEQIWSRSNLLGREQAENNVRNGKENQMDELTKRALRDVIEYLRDDEEEAWNEMDQPDDHIYHAIMRLEDWYEKQRGGESWRGFSGPVNGCRWHSFYFLFLARLWLYHPRLASGWTLTQPRDSRGYG